MTLGEMALGEMTISRCGSLRHEKPDIGQFAERQFAEN